MAAAWQSLPAASYPQTILDAIAGHDVTIVRGMTGSGKSTQVPQFLLEDAPPGAPPINAIVTQPRRIAAISMATRVAAERGERVGGSIGYRIRGESAVSTATHVTFVTTGVLLRQLSNYREAPKGGAGGKGDEAEDLLDGTTHVVVDEVHERAVDTDLILLRTVAARGSCASEHTAIEPTCEAKSSDQGHNGVPDTAQRCPPMRRTPECINMVQSPCAVGRAEWPVCDVLPDAPCGPFHNPKLVCLWEETLPRCRAERRWVAQPNHRCGSSVRVLRQWTPLPQRANSCPWLMR